MYRYTMEELPIVYLLQLYESKYLVSAVSKALSSRAQSDVGVGVVILGNMVLLQHSVHHQLVDQSADIYLVPNTETAKRIQGVMS